MATVSNAYLFNGTEATATMDAMIWEDADTASNTIKFQSGQIVSTAGWAENIAPARWDEVAKKPEPKLQPIEMIQPVPEMRFMAYDQLPAANMLVEGDVNDSMLTVKQIEVKAKRRSEKGYHFQFQKLHGVGRYFRESTEGEDFLGRNSMRHIKDDLYLFDPLMKPEWRWKRITELRKPPNVNRLRGLEAMVLSPAEAKARLLLQRYVGPQQYRKYLRDGYVTVQAHGFTWLVPGERSYHSMIEQWDKHSKVASYCVHFENHNIPPTDAAIMRMSLVFGGIEMLRQASNVYTHERYGQRTRKPESRILSLHEAFRQVKAESEVLVAA